MTQRLSTILLNWDLSGNLNHQISGGYSDLHKDKLLILAPSLPMLISHQLGAYRPTQGLILCSMIFDFYIYNKHLLMPINSALKKARIEFVKTDRGHVTLQFYPENRLFTNSDSLEEGSRQLLNNYLEYVSNGLPRQTWLIVKALISSTVETYQGFIKREIEQGIIGPRNDKWNRDISNQMAIQTMSIAEIYGPELPEDANLQDINENMNKLLLEELNEFKLVCNRMGIMR